MSHWVTVKRWTYDNAQRHVTAFRPISEAAHSWQPLPCPALTALVVYFCLCLSFCIVGKNVFICSLSLGRPSQRSAKAAISNFFLQRHRKFRFTKALIEDLLEKADARLFGWLVQGGPKKRGHILMTIILSNLNRFKNSFDWKIPCENICS